MKIINTNPDNKEITQLAMLATKVVHSMDLELTDFSETKARFLALVDKLDSKYQNNELLFDARAAILSQPVRKMDVYLITQKLVKMARAGKPSATERFAMRAKPAATGVVRHAAFGQLSGEAAQC